MIGNREAASLVVLVLAGAGCYQSAAARQAEAEDRAQLEQTRAELRQLADQLEDVETRLNAGQATVRLWAELAERHRTVSELSCKNLDYHWEAMANLSRRDRAAGAALGRRVAQVSKDSGLLDGARAADKSPASLSAPRGAKTAP